MSSLVPPVAPAVLLVPADEQRLGDPPSAAEAALPGQAPRCAELAALRRGLG